MLLAAALAVRALRQGAGVRRPPERSGVDAGRADAAADLEWPEPGAWRAALVASPLVAVGPDSEPTGRSG